MNITIDVDERMINDVQDKLGGFHKRAPGAISNALNRAATNVNSNIKKEVRKEYNIKSQDIGETLAKTKATKGSLRAEVKSSGRSVPLDRFKVSPMTVNPKRKSQIKIGVKKDGLKTVMGAFVADVSGKKVFQRSSKSRLPIKKLFGPSVPQMLENENVKEIIETEGHETFNKRLEHEIDRILEKGRG
ncbi:hypothetical protein J2Z76_000449 [Sedimentibacter acidaminivorans]|uniref:Prophage minor tail protein Z (GPZ) n=1 Tax=Sedimentibacter acidaminivorans TaxID=913099 RepID=A0ABS4GA79_9FIRM|nr:phage tail protein [Sedimentibacter acidaminivorans]MBP1924596.1 hypothetical protein [Sedimentibacter acidaminivorans]